MNIDIGGGTNPAFDHVNLDIQHGEGPWRRDARETPWPTGDSTVEHIWSSHFLEHVPAGVDHRIRVFNEAHRVLVPGGIFEIKLPLINWLDKETGERRYGGWEAIADPTHVSYWCAPESFLYFTGGAWSACADYGIRYWELLEWEVHGYGEAHVWMRKP